MSLPIEARFDAIPCTGVQLERGSPMSTPLYVELNTGPKAEVKVDCPKLRGTLCTAADLRGKTPRCIQLPPINNSGEFIPEPIPDLPDLSDKQASILSLAAIGLGDKHIAKKVSFKVSSVETYRKKIMSVYQVSTIGSAVGLGIKAGIFLNDWVAAGIDFTNVYRLTERDIALLREATKTGGSTSDSALMREMGKSRESIHSRFTRILENNHLNNRSHTVAFFLLAERMGLIPESKLIR